MLGMRLMREIPLWGHSWHLMMCYDRMKMGCRTRSWESEVESDDKDALEGTKSSL